MSYMLANQIDALANYFGNTTQIDNQHHKGGLFKHVQVV